MGRPGGYLLWTMREGYQQKSQRFAMMDAEITDLTSSGAAEMVVGPVVFDNFVLDHPGRYCLVGVKLMKVFAPCYFQILHDAQGALCPPCYVRALQCLSQLWPSTS